MHGQQNIKLTFSSIFKQIRPPLVFSNTCNIRPCLYTANIITLKADKYSNTENRDKMVGFALLIPCS